MDDDASISSLSTVGAAVVVEEESTSVRSRLTVTSVKHYRSSSRSSALSSNSTRASGDFRRGTLLYREEQRVSLRAFLRTILQNKRVAESKAMEEFLTARPITLNEEELLDIERRKTADAVRIEEQAKFYEIARQRAAELDVYMEKFRRSIVEQSEFDLRPVGTSKANPFQTASQNSLLKSRRRIPFRNLVPNIRNLLNGYE